MTTPTCLTLLPHHSLDSSAKVWTSKVLAWSGLCRASLITPAQLSALEDSHSSVPPVQVLIELLQSSKQDIYLFALGHLILRDQYDQPKPDWPTLTAALAHAPDQISQLAVVQQCVGHLLTCPESERPDLDAFHNTLIHLLSSSQTAAIALHFLSIHLTLPHTRPLIYNHPACHILLPAIITALQSQDPQRNYEAVLSLWLLTFDSSVGKMLPVDYPAVLQTLLELSKTTLKEKVQRMILAIWQNMLKHSVAIRQILTSLPLLPHLTNLAQRKFTDPELVASLTLLIEEIEEEDRQMSDYQYWRAGLLTAAPVREDPDFWTHNDLRADDLAILRRMLDSDQNHVLLRATTDIANFIRSRPESARITLKSTGTKERLLLLMSKEDVSEQVKFQALKAVQGLVGGSWK